MTNEEKITFIRQMLIKKLYLVKYLNKDEFLDFCNKLTASLRQDRSNNLLKNSKEHIEIKVDNFINFLINLGFNKKEIIHILYNNIKLIDVINRKDFLDKYVLLSVIEDEKNTVRKSVLYSNSVIFNKSLDEIYARYMLCKESRVNITKSLLCKENYLLFIKTFVSRFYIDKSYKILSEPISLEKLIKKYPINYDMINSLRKNKNNQNLSYSYLSKEDKIKLSIDNYSKASNLNELSDLLNISTSSLQRYLIEDSKKYVSKDKYIEIKEWLTKAKEQGLSLGGKTSQTLYDYNRDELGHFVGKGK